MNYPIGDVAKLFDISTFSIRFYEKKGLIAPIIDPKTAYRSYNLKHIIKIKWILYLKTAGFSIDEIKEMIQEPDFASNEIKLNQKEQEIDQKICQLQAWKTVLKTMKGRMNQIINMDDAFSVRYNTEETVLAVFVNRTFVNFSKNVCADFSQHYLCVSKDNFLKGKILGKVDFGMAITQSSLYYLERNNIPYRKVVFNSDQTQKYLYTLLEMDYENEPKQAMETILSHIGQKGLKIVSDVIFRYVTTTQMTMCDLYELWIPIE